MPPLRSSMLSVWTLEQCRSVSFIVFLLFFRTSLHRIVIGPWFSSIQSSHLLFGRALDLFPVGFHLCTLLVSLLTFIHNTCPSHFNRICLLRIGHWYLLADRFICDAVFIRNPHNSSEPAIFADIKPILHVFGETSWLTSVCEYWDN